MAAAEKFMASKLKHTVPAAFIVPPGRYIYVFTPAEKAQRFRKELDFRWSQRDTSWDSASQERVTQIMDGKFELKKSGEDVVQIYEFESTGSLWKRLVFVFKNGKLNAYVWGFRPQ